MDTHPPVYAQISYAKRVTLSESLLENSWSVQGGRPESDGVWAALSQWQKGAGREIPQFPCSLGGTNLRWIPYHVSEAPNGTEA